MSISSAGEQANSWCHDASISADGRYVAFWSPSDNLVPDDTNNKSDIFIHDRLTGETTRVSVNSNGVQANSHSKYSSISADGRYVAFDSGASNLVSDDTSFRRDVFVHDLLTGETTRVSIDSAGGEADGGSERPSISGDGRYVAFQSDATNLVPGDTNVMTDIFVKDRHTGRITRVSVDSAGGEADGDSDRVSISADGRYVGFESAASNLVPEEDTNGAMIDIFVHDRQTGQTTRVSVNSDGVQADLGSKAPSISGDGRYVAFQSQATNLVPGIPSLDVYLHDCQTGQTTRVSVDSQGVQGNAVSSDPSISAGGRYVAFSSFASNLVPDDTNVRTDVFVHNRWTGRTIRVSISSEFAQADGPSHMAAISADGRTIAFQSSASNLVPDDTNGFSDVFVHELGMEGDFDADGDVDLDDFGQFAACYNGSARPPAATCAEGVDADLDGDGDVDLDDFAIFAQNYTGAL